MIDHDSGHGVRLLLFPLMLLGGTVSPCLSAQDGRPDRGEWNDSRTVEVVREAIDSRRFGRDNDLDRFSAYAEGQVHYLAEYGDRLRDQVVRSDRVALELRWRRGVGSLQTLVGRRHASWMPTSIKYHIDHLSLVVENFGDRIHIGDGDEVRDVLHPVAPGALGFYEYRLADSLGIMVNDRLTELYRLKVRPLHPDSAGVVGTIDVERESFALVRMAVSFTPASYVDPTVRTVSVDLENALVANRVWLPARQHTEVRRQLRFLDMPFGGTIRSSFEVLSWDLDPPRDVWIPPGHRVRSVDERDLAVYAGWRTWDPKAAPEIMRADSALFETIRDDAVRVAGGRYLGGSSRLRFHVPSLSSVVRVRRAEGAFTGLGAKYDVSGNWTLDVLGGYAHGAGHGEVEGGVTARYGSLRFGVRGWQNVQSDVGPWSAASGLVSTGGALITGDDYLDPFHESGGRIWAGLSLIGGSATLGLAISDHEQATLVLDPPTEAEPRALMPGEPGRDARVEAGWHRPLPSVIGSQLQAGIDVDLATFGDYDYTRLILELTAAPVEADATWWVEGRAGAGLVTGSEPVQRSLRIGGRGTVPGYEFRRFNGEQVAFINAALSRNVVHPWLRIRALGAVGWSHRGEEVVTLDGPVPGERYDLDVPDTGGVRPSLGAGISLFYDIVRLDVARGLEDGIWEWVLSVNPQFRTPL